MPACATGLPLLPRIDSLGPTPQTLLPQVLWKSGCLLPGWPHGASWCKHRRIHAEGQSKNGWNNQAPEDSGSARICLGSKIVWRHPFLQQFYMCKLYIRLYPFVVGDTLLFLVIFCWQSSGIFWTYPWHTHIKNWGGHWKIFLAKWLERPYKAYALDTCWVAPFASGSIEKNDNPKCESQWWAPTRYRLIDIFAAWWGCNHINHP